MRLFIFEYQDENNCKHRLLVEGNSEQHAIEHLSDWNDNQDYLKNGELSAVGQNIWEI